MIKTLLNQVLGESEKCVSYFYLKTWRTFWPAQYLLSYRADLSTRPLSSSSAVDLASSPAVLSQLILSCRPGLLSRGPLSAHPLIQSWTPLYQSSLSSVGPDHTASPVASEPYRAAPSPGPAPLARVAPRYPWGSPGPLLQVFAQMSLLNEAWIRGKKLQPTLTSYLLSFPYNLSAPPNPFDLR